MTPFIQESINEVIHTLIEAIILVAIVVLVFLQNWRSTLIPLVAVPVAIVGTFAVMAAIGFSLNNLTLFGLVLAIGIVVDDAIVVVEAVEHHIEEGLTPRQAAHKAMEQVSGPVVAVALVLSAVFVPCAFISGITGQFFRQFALTIAVSTVISAFNSLTLSPALAALLLQPRGAQGRSLGRLLDLLLGWFFRLFNWAFPPHAPASTPRLVGLALRGSVVVLVLYGGLLVLTWWTSTRLPTGYIPNQDQGRFYIAVQLPDAASLERTQAGRRPHQPTWCQPDAGRRPHVTDIAGQSFTLNANGSNFGNFFITLDDFDKRRDPSLYSDGHRRPRCASELAKEVPEAIVDHLHAAAGVRPRLGERLQDHHRGPRRPRRPAEAAKSRSIGSSTRAKKERRRSPTCSRSSGPTRRSCSWTSTATSARRWASTRSDVFTTLQIYLGSFYVNDFNRFGRTWQVVVQAEGRVPRRPGQDQAAQGAQRRRRHGAARAPSSPSSEVGGPINIGRYNMYPAAAILGGTKPGVSTGAGHRGDGSAAAPRSCRRAWRYEWTEINYMQIDAAKNIWNNLIFPLAVVFVFLVLAAQYESWALPLAVILVVPMCILGSLTGVAVTHGDINIFTQIGFVVLVGLASKNAILIVEFAKHKHEEGGLSRREATLAACKLRLRPILMTSFAFILGVVPLLVAAGAGAEMRRTLGMAVFSGMLGVTLFGIFLTPVFFYVIEGFAETPLFSSERARRVGTRAAATRAASLTLGLPWLLAAGAGAAWHGRARQRPRRVPDAGQDRRRGRSNGRTASMARPRQRPCAPRRQRPQRTRRTPTTPTALLSK